MTGSNIYRFFFVFILCFSIKGFSQKTNLMIRAKAKDAKFIGSSIGGARILVKDAVTGAILDEGITTGSTGDTKKIMKNDWKRSQLLSDDKTAGFTAKIDIDAPLFVTVEALAPYNKKQASVLSSTQLWVIPGKDIKGDGVVLEIPGFVVDILAPQTHERIKASEKIELSANVVMMCGCPVTEGGIWDANQYEVKAIITDADGNSNELELKSTEKPSTFGAETFLEKGLYEVLVYAYDPETGNTGVDKTNIIIN